MSGTIERAAVAYCVRLTAGAARNFYYGIRLLPLERMQALCAIYAYAREIDDVADGTGSTEFKLGELARLRSQLTSLGGQRDPRCVALRLAAEAFPVPLSALEEIIDGVTLDVRGKQYDETDDMLEYCDKVAGTVGRLCVSVMDSSDRDLATRLAHRLWVGMQLTNIIRDVSEDSGIGRTYIPRAHLRRFGLEETWLEPETGPDPISFAKLIRHECHLARLLMEDGLCCLPLLDRRGAACMAAMAGIYERLLFDMWREPSCVLAGRASLSSFRKQLTAARAVVGLPAVRPAVVGGFSSVPVVNS
jgi:phytoene synthase